MNRIIRLAIVLLQVALLTGCEGDAFVTSRGDIDDANEMLATGDYEGALAAYDALQSRNPRIAFNRGLALYHLKKFDEAVAAFDEARAAKDAGMKAASYYHVGNVHSRKALDSEEAGDKEGALVAWEDAVAAYENALLIDSDHADAKYQLEVALFRVDPPCHLRNDAFEPNNQFSTAKAVELAASEEKEAAPGERVATQALWLCPDDEDWLIVSLEPGDRVKATVKRTEGPEHATAGLSMWAPDGRTRVDPMTPVTAGEALPTKVALDPAPTAGEYRVRVANPRGDDFGAEVEFSVRPACQRTEDEHEPNEAVGAAKALEPGEVPLRMCPDGHDWFQVPVGEGESLKVTAKIQAQAGELKLELTDAAGTVLAEATKGEKDSVVALAYGRPAGPVFIHAYGEKTEAVYLLKTEVIPVCPAREDDKEDNDTIETATSLEPGDHDGLQLCPRDPDFFRVKVEAGESIVAHLSAKPLAGVPTLEVLKLDGTVVGRGFPLEGGLLAMALDPGAGEYAIKVDGEMADASYDLKFEVLPPCPEGNDKEEPNDSFTDAKVLDPPEPPQQEGEEPKVTRKLLRICPGDKDWFRVAVTPESPLYIAGIEFVHEKGDLELVQYDADGETRVSESNQSTVEKNVEGVVVPPPEIRVPDPTDYLLRISGAESEGAPAADVQNFYLLSLREQPPSGEDGEQSEDQQDQQDQQDEQEKQEDQQQQPQEPEQPRPDRSTMEKEMEREDEGEQRNLEAERARQRVRHLPPALKDW